MAQVATRGNSATLVHYVNLLELAFLVVPVFKFSSTSHRTKRSLPKWIFPNSALIDTAAHGDALGGYVFENLVGAHLLKITYGNKRYELKYWWEDNREVDFVITENNNPLLAVEVKSGRIKNVPSAKMLKNIGLRAPLFMVHKENIECFLMTRHLDDVQSLMGVKCSPIRITLPCIEML